MKHDEEEGIEALEEISAAAIILSNPYKGHPRIPTGIPSIDKNTRGGLPIPSVIVFQGKPGSCKTALACQIAVKAAKEQRAVVVGLFPDEGRLRAVIRVGQNLGFDREKLEDGDEDEAVKLAERMAEMDMFFPDPDLITSTVEGVVRNYLSLPEFAGRPLILIVDSTQTANSELVPDDASPRDRATGIMNAIRRLALATPCLVLDVSQINRGAYRNKKDSENSDPLAAGMDSGRIEYAAELVLHLDGDPEKTIRGRAPKSRLGNKFSCELYFDKRTAILTEIDAEGKRDEDAETDQRLLAAAKAMIVTQLKGRSEGLSATGLFEVCGGRKTVHFKARNELIIDGKLSFREDGTKVFFVLISGLS